MKCYIAGMNIDDYIKSPILSITTPECQEHFRSRCKTFLNEIFEWNVYYSDPDIERNSSKFIAFWCDISNKLIDLAIPEKQFYDENGIDKTVKQFISKLKELASLPYEERFPKEETTVKEPRKSKKQSPDKNMEKKTHHVDIHNVGEHNPDNRFMLYDSPAEQYEWWKRNNNDCIPIGFCEEAFKTSCGFKRIAFVYEDEKGNRYYVHVPENWKELDF